MNHWLWVTGPEFYLDDDRSERADLEPPSEDWWSCGKDTSIGDLILLYRKGLKKDIAYLLQAMSEAEEGEDWDFVCDYQSLHKFQEPLPISALRADPVLRAWGPLRANFQGTAFQVEERYWHRLVQLLKERNPDLRWPTETVWRMSMRFGTGGYEMWPRCRELGVAAIGYRPFIDVDLSKTSNYELSSRWAKLSGVPKHSLRCVAYEMKAGDTILVKQGPDLVGRGTVRQGYRFDRKNRVVNPEEPDFPWQHQVAVEWKNDFCPIPDKLGAPRHTVLKLDKAKLDILRMQLASTLPEEHSPTACRIEGALRRITVNAYERDHQARADCVEHYGWCCTVCGVSLEERYGSAAKDLIHVHHLKLLSQIGKSYKVDPIEDLRPVCPNCHAVIHRKTPPYSIEEVRRMLKKQSRKMSE